MLESNTSRIGSPTMALFLEGDRHVAHTVPMGSIVDVDPGDLPMATQLVNVLWAGKEVMMFAQDIRLRGTRTNNGSSK